MDKISFASLSVERVVSAPPPFPLLLLLLFMESGGESDPPPDPSKSISILNLCLSFTCLCVYLRVSLPSFCSIGQKKVWGRLFNHSKEKFFSFPRQDCKRDQKECMMKSTRAQKKKNRKTSCSPESDANIWRITGLTIPKELPPLGTLSKDESTKTTSTPAASAGKTSSYVPPHLRNRQGGGNTERGGDRRDTAVVAADEIIEVGSFQRNKT